jgi:hypothetical protein
MPAKRKALGGSEIVAALEETFRKYLALEPGLPLVLALWTLATHLFECFDAFPYLAITSPTKRCGKTRLAEIIEVLSNNGQRIVGATPAAIFRTIQAQVLEGGTVTLILDEAEVLGHRSDRSEALREILNAGYRQGQFVSRCERKGEQGFEVLKFNVYCPKVIVLIGTLTDTLADRCIPIMMRRRKSDEKPERFIFSVVRREAKRIRGEALRWMISKGVKAKVRKHHRQDLGFLQDREAELWSPLFSVCTVAAPDRLEQLKAISLAISGAKLADEPNDMGVLLLRDIRAVFLQSQQDRLATVEMLHGSLDSVNGLNQIEDSPWGRWSRGAPMDARQLARLLRPFGVSSRNLRMGDDRVVKGYERADFEDAWATYLPSDDDPAATTLQTAPDAPAG